MLMSVVPSGAVEEPLGGRISVGRVLGSGAELACAVAVCEGMLVVEVGASGSDSVAGVLVVLIDARARVLSVKKVNCELIDGVTVGVADTVLSEVNEDGAEADEMIVGRTIAVELLEVELLTLVPETLRIEIKPAGQLDIPARREINPTCS